jgi:hypothetical protein
LDKNCGLFRQAGFLKSLIRFQARTRCASGLFPCELLLRAKVHTVSLCFGHGAAVIELFSGHRLPAKNVCKIAGSREKLFLVRQQNKVVKQ